MCPFKPSVHMVVDAFEETLPPLQARGFGQWKPRLMFCRSTIMPQSQSLQRFEIGGFGILCHENSIVYVYVHIYIHTCVDICAYPPLCLRYKGDHVSTCQEKLSHVKRRSRSWTATLTLASSSGKNPYKTVFLPSSLATSQWQCHYKALHRPGTVHSAVAHCYRCYW